jgi:hypothetical protein
MRVYIVTDLCCFPAEDVPGATLYMFTGHRSDVHTVRGVGGMGIRMLTLVTETSLDTEDRGLQVPMVLHHDYIPHTYNCFFRSYDLLDLSTQILSGVRRSCRRSPRRTVAVGGLFEDQDVVTRTLGRSDLCDKMKEIQNTVRVC